MLKIGNAPCSWGVIENTEGERYDYVRVLNEMAEAGYAGTELGDKGFMPSDPVKLRAELDSRGLQLAAAWVSVRLYDADYHDRGIESAVETARILAEVGGPDNILVIGPDHSTVPLRHDKSGRITPEMGLDEAGWALHAEGAMRVAEAVKRETGLRSAVHPHASSYLETPAEVAKFMSMTDPSLIGYVFDTGHYTLGGGDPIEGIRTHADRIWHVHFKDFDPRTVAQADANDWGYQQLIAQGMFSELGQGAVDFPAVRQALNEIGYDGWIIVEQDMLIGMGSPLESNTRNRNYLKSIGL
ncbi:MAG: TIM barrel protein [Candidatus Promineifilaceae bacterium]